MNKKIMKQFLCLLFFTFAFFGCEDDDTVTIENSSEQPKFTINLISKSELSENKSVKAIVETLPNSKDLISQDENTNLQGRLVYMEEYDFYVDDERAYHITSGDYESYTFAIKRPENNGLTENLVLSKQTDGTYKASIMSYDLTETERQSVIDGVIPVDIENKTSVQPLPEVSSSSDSGIVPIGSTGIYYDTSTGVCVKPMIDLSGETISYTWASVNCPQYIVDNDIGGGGNSSGSGSNDNSGNNSGSNSGYDSGYDPTNGNTTGGDDGGNPNGTNSSNSYSNTNNNNTTQNPDGISTVTKPLEVLDADGVFWECFGYGSLAYSRAQLLDEVQRTAIANFINMNGCSENTQSFLQTSIDVLLEEAEVDFEELEEMYNDMDKECQALFFLNHIIESDKTLPQFLKDNFLGNDTYNIQFSDINIGSSVDANANTRLPENLVFNENTAIIIEFDNAYLDNATNLSIIQTTAHELVHAYLTFLYIENDLLSFNPDYTELKSAFENYESNPNNENGIALGEAMHEVYDDFLDVIIDSVFDYATTNNITGATLEYCQKLVIGSHQYTQAFQQLTSEQQIEYSTIATNEQDGLINAKGAKCD